MAFELVATTFQVQTLDEGRNEQRHGGDMIALHMVSAFLTHLPFCALYMHAANWAAVCSPGTH